MTNLTTHPADKPQHIRNNLEFFFPHIRDIRHTITNLPHQKGSNCFKKKKNNTRKRESEGDGCTNMRPQPPRGQSRINYHRKKRGRKGRNLAIEDRGRKTSSVPSEPPSGQGHNEFFSSLTEFFLLLSFFFWTWRTSIQLRFFDIWRKFHSTSVDFSWVRSSSYPSSYGPGLLIPRGPWAHPSRLRSKLKQSTNPNQVIRQNREHNGPFQSHNTSSGSGDR